MRKENYKDDKNICDAWIINGGRFYIYSTVCCYPSFSSSSLRLFSCNSSSIENLMHLWFYRSFNPDKLTNMSVSRFSTKTCTTWSGEED